jgi:hypothetical protein
MIISEEETRRENGSNERRKSAGCLEGAGQRSLKQAAGSDRDGAGRPRLAAAMADGDWIFGVSGPLADPQAGG